MASMRVALTGWLLVLMLGIAGCATVQPTPTNSPSTVPPPTPSPSFGPMPPLEGSASDPTVVAYVDATGDGAINSGTLHKVRPGKYFEIAYACDGEAEIKITVTYSTDRSGQAQELTVFSTTCRRDANAVFTAGGLDQSAYFAMGVETSAQHYWVQMTVSGASVAPD